MVFQIHIRQNNEAKENYKVMFNGLLLAHSLYKNIMMQCFKIFYTYFGEEQSCILTCDGISNSYRINIELKENHK